MNLKLLLKRNKILFLYLKEFKRIYDKFILYPFLKKKNHILFNRYYFKTNSKEIREAYLFMNKHGVSMIPFNFTKIYNKNYKIDNELGYPYVIINSDKIFFPKEYSKKIIIDSVNNALLEQDTESPHRYLPPQKKVKGHTAILIGGSDGIFGLELLKCFEHIFIFECDDEWIKPLSLTLKPHSNKFTIVNKFVGEFDQGNSITLDSYFKNYHHPIDFMQQDVEGNSLSILKGSRQILTKNNIYITIACYHTRNEANDLKVILESVKYSCSYSQKFVFMWMKNLKKPYIRKAVLYAKK